MQNKIELATPSDFNWQECLWYLNRGFDDCMYRVYSTSVRRAFLIRGAEILVEISHVDRRLIIEIISGKSDEWVKEELKNFVVSWFDLETNLQPFYRLLNLNPQLSYMTGRYGGLRFIGMPDLFESLAWCIIGQQINLNFAYLVKRRLVETYGSSLLFENEHYWIFPSPLQLANLEVAQLRKLQFSNNKAAYLISIATAMKTGTLSMGILTGLPDFQSKQDFLTSFKGIGVWTANYVLMKTLKEFSAVPFGDAGMINALKIHNIISNKQESEKVTAFFKCFPGWESYIVFYLWRSLAKSQ